jgi:hypothetical protein
VQPLLRIENIGQPAMALLVEPPLNGAHLEQKRDKAKTLDFKPSLRQTTLMPGHNTDTAMLSDVLQIPKPFLEKAFCYFLPI